jgi:hypothetical protein
MAREKIFTRLILIRNQAEKAGEVPWLALIHDLFSDQAAIVALLS